ncbi:hypothetical protein RHSP_65201 [Rhizobium freirei PRF 81]|uniref:Uncharacterized protein n=1 Tax=Rhizobium freirei PRF 81 TaxID=363754 RepID=N6U7J5_9HYPH|nr:hypothetical protein RHSP_65201 [Rhizobium freirei PRF 81]
MGFHQHVAPAAADAEHDLRQEFRRVLGVGRSTAFEAKLQMPATLRLGGHCAFGKEFVGDCQSHAGCHCASHEFAAAKPARSHTACQIFRVVVHSPVPSFLSC